MDKSKVKNRVQHNATAVHITAEKFGYTDRYVRACLKGDRVGIMPDEVKRIYKEVEKTINETINNLKTV